MYECRIKAEEYPKEGEIVIARTVSTNDNILSMSLCEYGEIPGLVLSSELSKKRIRSIHQITKVGSLEVCQVLKVDMQKHHIDLSLKSVGDEEKRECLEHSARNKLSYQIMLKAAKLADIPVKQLYEEVGYTKAKEHGSLHAFFVCARENPGILQETKYGECFQKVIEDQFKPSTYRVRVDVDVTNPVYGIEAIKEGFLCAKKEYPQLEIALLRTPTYSISVLLEDRERGFCIVNAASDIVKSYAEEHDGTFSISCPAKVYGEKSRHALLESTKPEAGKKKKEEDSSDDSSD